MILCDWHVFLKWTSDCQTEYAKNVSKRTAVSKGISSECGGVDGGSANDFKVRKWWKLRHMALVSLATGYLSLTESSHRGFAPFVTALTDVVPEGEKWLLL